VACQLSASWMQALSPGSGSRVGVVKALNRSCPTIWLRISPFSAFGPSLLPGARQEDAKTTKPLQKLRSADGTANVASSGFRDQGLQRAVAILESELQEALETNKQLKDELRSR